MYGCSFPLDLYLPMQDSYPYKGHELRDFSGGCWASRRPGRWAEGLRGLWTDGGRHCTATSVHKVCPAALTRGLPVDKSRDGWCARPRPTRRHAWHPMRILVFSTHDRQRSSQRFSSAFDLGRHRRDADDHGQGRGGAVSAGPRHRACPSAGADRAAAGPGAGRGRTPAGHCALHGGQAVPDQGYRAPVFYRRRQVSPYTSFGVRYSKA